MHISPRELFDLSSVQKDIYFDQVLNAPESGYNIAGYLDIHGAVDSSLLQQALHLLISRHDNLRTVFTAQPTEAIPIKQFILTEYQPPLKVIDLSEVKEARQAAEDWMLSHVKLPFTLHEKPLFDVHLLKLGSHHHQLLFKLHHLITDAWTNNLISSGLSDIYTALARGEQPELPGTSYLDFIKKENEYFASEDYERDKKYWQEKFSVDHEPMVPKYKISAASNEFDKEYTLTLPRSLYEQMAMVAKENKGSIFHALLAVFYGYFRLYKNQQKIAFGMPVLNRANAALRKIPGMMMSVSATAMDYQDSLGLAEITTQIARTLKSDYRHQRFPLRELTAATGATPYDVIVSYERFEQSLNFADCPAQLNIMPSLYSTAPLGVHIVESSNKDEDVILSLVYKEAFFSQQDIADLGDRLRLLISHYIQAPQQPLSTLPLLTEEESATLNGWNKTDNDWHIDKTLVELIQRQVAETPGQIAVSFGNKHLTWQQLDAQANQLGRYLSARGVTTETRVALCLDRSLEMVVTLLAVMKAGGAYVPLDPSWPKNRLTHVINDCQPQAVIVQQHTSQLFSASGPVVINLDEACWREEDTDAFYNSSLTPDNLAYLIYTSGSTGNPKGVMVEHRSIVNRILWMQDAYPLDVSDAILQKTPYGFDVSVWEFFWPLSFGAKLVMAKPEGHKDPSYLTEVIARENITTLHFVPSMLDIFLAVAPHNNLPSLRRVICSGESLSAMTVDTFLQHFPGVELHNLYGPTEASVDVTAWPCSAGEKIIPIGKPIANIRMYVLDPHLRMLPAGCSGELYISGVGVARGYFNLPKLSEERFIPNPYADSGKHTRLYRTGDTGRYRQDGAIEYIGRNDHQVKIRGFRIEADEISYRLREINGIAEACVLDYKDGHQQTQLAAYYRLSDSQPLSPAALREALLVNLPDYMVPAVFIEVPTFPLSANGKLDRKALPDPTDIASQRQHAQPPQGENEVLVATLWEEIFRQEGFCRHDDFFALGGNSLSAIRFMTLLSQRGKTLDARKLFQAPVLKDIAAQIYDVAPEQNSPIREAFLPELKAADKALLSADQPENIKAILPLTSLQTGILYHYLSEPEGDNYILNAAFAFSTRESVEAFTAALNHIITRHDALRTAIHWENVERPLQVVLHNASVDYEEIAIPEDCPDTLAYFNERFHVSRIRFNLTQAPLMRLVVGFDTQQQQWVGMLLFHHMMIDHVALALIQQELRILLKGEKLLTTPVPWQAHFAEGGVFYSPQDLSWFTHRLAEIDKPTFPLNLQQMRVATDDTDEYTQPLPQDLSALLHRQAQRHGVSVASLHHLAWARVISMLAGKDNVAFCTVLMGRMQAVQANEAALGLFINTLPLYVDFLHLDAIAAVKRTQQELGELLRHDNVSLNDAQRCSAVPAPTPLTTALFNYRHGGAEDIRINDELIPGIRLLSASERTSWPLMLTVDDVDGQFSLNVQVGLDGYAKSICDYMEQALMMLCVALESAHPAPLLQQSILPEQEFQRVVYDCNQTQVDFPDVTLCELLEKQRRATPERPALSGEGTTLTYEELHCLADRLAAELLRRGANLGDRIATCLPRGLHLPVALIGILKAGCAYVPLDPAYPAQRIDDILENAQPRFIITDATTEALIGERASGKLNIHEMLVQAGTQAVPLPQLESLTPASLAYLIYTSGSTGKPKGVMIEHRNVVNFILWARQTFAQLASGTTLFSTSVCFDLSVFELFGPLVSGGHVTVSDNILTLMTHSSSAHLLNTVPSALDVLTDANAIGDEVAVINVAGEPLKQHVAEKVLTQTNAQWLNNLYGPSETTTYSTWVSMRAGEAFKPHIGKPIANTQVYLLDPHGLPVPCGVEGEIYIAGRGVSRGYHNQQELTEERFNPDPFALQSDARMYRTGDTGIRLPDGNICYTGRNDRQVKVRGYRVEPGEIEKTLLAQAEIKDAVVLIAGEQQQASRLMAFVIPVNTAAFLSPAAMLDRLRKTLPDYMVPQQLIPVAAFPLTPNGKIDRQALLKQAELPIDDNEYSPPVGEREISLAAIWADVLQLDRVGRTDNFFHLGGNSLLAIQAANRMREAGFPLDIKLMIQNPTIEGYLCAIEMEEIVL
jgi:arthrofactin-type cyclic lipopeptide synthetase C